MKHFLRELLLLLLFLLLLFISSHIEAASYNQDTEGEPPLKNQKNNVVFYEGFENGIPSGWSQVYLNSPDGQNAQWDTRKGAGIISPGTQPIIGEPDSAAVGLKNLVFQWQGQGHHTRLISPPINLEFIVHPVFTFWHAQAKWGSGQDRLAVYYRLGEDGPLKQLAVYNHAVSLWTPRSISLNDHESSEFYIILDGVSMHGSGICIDEFTITETGYIAKELDTIVTDQASTDFVPTGSNNNPILRTQTRVTGNTGELLLQNFTVESLNTDDADVKKIKLYISPQENFYDAVLLAELNGFSNGMAVFQNINYNLATGYSYLWVTYDIADNAAHGNHLDARIPAQGITVAGNHVPVEAHSPFGWRQIVQTIFYDDFEEDMGWSLSGEWERDIPQGLGGSYGLPGASYAHVGQKVLGTDLTGLGDYPGDYEPGLEHAEQQAISPEINCFYYTDVKLSFHRWLNIEFADKAYIHTSSDGGETWQQVFVNTNYISAVEWTQQTINLPGANRQGEVLVRFSIGPTDMLNNYSGWNIDNLVLTGTYVSRDVGISEFLGPEEGCGMSDSETVSVRVENFGAKEVNAPIPIGFSLNGGQSWTMDTLHANLGVGESVVHTFGPKANFSIPGRYNVVVKTFWSEDQDKSNDAYQKKVFSIPYITPPYSQTFTIDDGLWTGYGYRSSWSWGTPFGQHINPKDPGSRAWVTNRGGGYNELEASWLESPCFNFSGMQNPVMEFYLNTHTPELLAGTTIQFSADEGESWNTLGILDEAFAWNWYDNDLNIQLLDDNFGTLHGWTGNSEGWKRIRAILDPALGGEDKIKFRLAFAGHHLGGTTNYWEGVGFDAVSIYESPHDVGITALVSPGNACELSQSQSITVSIENFGLNTLEAGKQIPVGIDINEESPVYETFTLAAPLTPGALANFTFENTFDLSAEIMHTITAYTMLPGDSDFYQPGVFNDTLQVQISVFGYPEFTLGPDIYTTAPDTVLLDAGSGFNHYLWQDGSLNQTFQVTDLHSAFYAVSVTDINGCQVTDSLEVITRDFQVLAISHPQSDCELSSEEYITVSIRNSGPDTFSTGTELPMQLQFNSMPWDADVFVLSQALLPGQTVEFTFGNPVDFSHEGEYTFTVSLDYQDADPSTNTLNASVFVHGYPQPFIGDTLYTLTPMALVLDAGDYVEYLWQDGSQQRHFTPDSPYSKWYNVSVIDQHGCPGSDSVLVITYDIEIAEVTDPQDACELTDNESIGIRLINHGPETLQPGSSFPFALKHQGSIISEDTLVLNEPWHADEELIFRFAPNINMSMPQAYHFTVSLTERDANPDNDIMAFSVTVHGYPNVYLPAFITTDYPESILLAPGEGYDSYLWQDGSTGSTFQVQTWGEHRVEVGNAFGCITVAQTRILPELFDIAIFAVSEPLSICANEGSRQVVFTLKNTGNSPILSGTQLTLRYTLEGASMVEENYALAATLLPGATRNYTFAQTLDLSTTGMHTLEAEVYYEWDEDPTNNILNETLEVHEIPQPNLGGNIYTLQPQGMVLTPGPGYESYLWQDGSSQSSFVVESMRTASYSVTVTDSNGCQNSDTIEVVTYNLILDEIIAPASHCTLTNQEAVVVRVLNEGHDDFDAGTTLSIGFEIEGQQTAVEDFILTRSWQKNEPYTFVFNTTANLSATGNYTFRAFVATLNAESTSDTLTVNIHVPGMPVVTLGNDIYTSKPDTVVLNAGAGYASYYWHDGRSDQTYNVNSFGWKWVRVTDIYGCTGSDTLYVGFFQNVPTLQEELLSRVYPNPARHSLTIEIGREMDGVTAEVVDISGSVVFREQLFREGITRQEIDISHLQAGIYFLRLQKGAMRKTHKITIIR